MSKPDKKTVFHFFVARYEIVPPNPKAETQHFRTLFRSTDERVLYFGGEDRSTHRKYLDNFEIVQNYGYARLHSAEADRIYAQYEQDFPPEPFDLDAPHVRVHDVDGWLSPEGRFWKAGFMDHTGLAFDLVNAFYRGEGKLYADMTLFKHGWICVSHSGMRYEWVNANAPTEAQMAFFQHLRELNLNFAVYVEKIDRFFLDIQRRYQS